MVDYEDSFLTRMINSIRLYTDEPSVAKKYTDEKLILEIEKAFPLVIGEQNRNKRRGHIVATYDVDISNSSATEYILPPTIGKIMAIYDKDSDWGTKKFYFSRGNFSPKGRGVWVEGNILHVQPNEITSTTALTVEYIPSYTARLHNGTCTLNSDGDVVTLTESPNQGSLDTRNNAYAGSVLRILGADTNDFIQERKITSYNRKTREATLEKALDPIPSENILYEICPPIHRGLDDVIASKVSRDILLIEGSTQRANSIQAIHTERMRNLRLDAYYSNLSEASRVDIDSYRNRNPRRRRR